MGHGERHSHLLFPTSQRDLFIPLSTLSSHAIEAAKYEKQQRQVASDRPTDRPTSRQVGR